MRPTLFVAVVLFVVLAAGSMLFRNQRDSAAHAEAVPASTSAAINANQAVADMGL